MNKENSKWIFYLSIAATIGAVIGAFGVDLWLASTQWLIVAAVLAVWAVYLQSQSKGE